MAKMKIDLHMHGPIGFQPYWLRTQGYEGKNLLQLIAEACFNKQIGVCAITSEAPEIRKGSIHDRFGQLVDYARRLPKEYDTEKSGEIVLSVHKDEKAVHIVNGQTVICYENGKRVDHLVIGSNQVPNKTGLEDAIKFCKDEGLLQGAEHPYMIEHCGIGEEVMKKHCNDYDFVEGYNSQLIFPFFSNKNKKAQEFAVEHNKPWIAVSDAHRIEDAGISYIECEDIDVSNGEKLMNSLKKAIRQNEFLCHIKCEPFMEWFNWTRKFLWGIKMHAKEVA